MPRRRRTCKKMPASRKIRSTSKFKVEEAHGSHRGVGLERIAWQQAGLLRTGRFHLAWRARRPGRTASREAVDRLHGSSWLGKPQMYLFTAGPWLTRVKMLYHTAGDVRTRVRAVQRTYHQIIWLHRPVTRPPAWKHTPTSNDTSRPQHTLRSSRRHPPAQRRHRRQAWRPHPSCSPPWQQGRSTAW